ncbi:hypothetical protein [Sphingomonas glacialis]|nr:hypothetical protein [Sphingomonas glacialis]
MDVAPRRFKIAPTDRDVHVARRDFRNAFRWLRANVSRWICS